MNQCVEPHILLNLNTLLEHQDIVKKFQNSEMAKEINENLLKLESIDFNGFEEIHRIIKMKLEIKELDDRKKTS